jgi:hypothetical protein
MVISFLIILSSGLAGRIETKTLILERAVEVEHLRPTQKMAHPRFIYLATRYYGLDYLYTE